MFLRESVNTRGCRTSLVFGLEMKVVHHIVTVYSVPQNHIKAAAVRLGKDDSLDARGFLGADGRLALGVAALHCGLDGTRKVKR